MESLILMEFFPPLFIFLIYFLIGGKLLYNVVLVSAIQQCKLAIIIHVSPPFLVSLPSSHPTALDHHRVLAGQLLTNYLFYTWWCTYVCAKLSSFASLSPFPTVSMSLFSVCISIPSLKIDLSIPFLEIPYIYISI